MFFVRTEERVITREELLESENWHTEYLISAICEDENEERKYISGVSTIQKKWDPEVLCVKDKSDNIVETLMSQTREKVDDSEDLEVIHQIIEETVVDYESRLEEERKEEIVLFDWESREEKVRRLVVERLQKLYRQEYCRLVWNGSICHRVEVMNYVYGRRLDIVSGAALKSIAEEKFFGGCSNSNRCWVGVNNVFRLKMLKFSEIMTIVKLREYFDVMAGLLEAETVFESDMRPNPFHILGEPVYYHDAICDRLGTKLVQGLQYFGYALGNNRCYQAECELEKILRLQNEVCKITDQKVKTLAKEALEILNQSMDALKTYFDNWNNYIEKIFCGDQDVNTYIKGL